MFPLSTVSPPRYELRAPVDGKWGGLSEDGNWTGTMGALQREEADFSLLLTPTSRRLDDTDFSTIYFHDPIVVVSRKPRPLPHYLAIILPFART